MRYKILIAALLLLLGVVGITNQALVWGDWGGGGTYWGQGYQSCGYNCSSGEGGYHSYRYLVGFQDGVQDAQARNVLSHLCGFGQKNN